MAELEFGELATEAAWDLLEEAFTSLRDELTKKNTPSRPRPAVHASHRVNKTGSKSIVGQQASTIVTATFPMVISRLRIKVSVFNITSSGAVNIVTWALVVRRDGVAQTFPQVGSGAFYRPEGALLFWDKAIVDQTNDNMIRHSAGFDAGDVRLQVGDVIELLYDTSLISAVEWRYTIEWVESV